MSKTFMDRLIDDLASHQHPYVHSFNGERGDVVVAIPEIVTGVYTCTDNQNGQVVYINHEQGRAPDMVFACMEVGGLCW